MFGKHASNGSSAVDCAMSLGNLISFSCLLDGSLGSTMFGLQFTEELALSPVAIAVMLLPDTFMVTDRHDVSSFRT